MDLGTYKNESHWGWANSSDSQMPYKKEYLDVVPRTHIKNPDVMACDHNSSAGGTEKGGSLRLAG